METGNQLRGEIKALDEKTTSLETDIQNLMHSNEITELKQMRHRNDSILKCIVQEALLQVNETLILPVKKDMTQNMNQLKQDYLSMT